MRPRAPTEGEALVVQKLAEAWNAFLELGSYHPDDFAEFRSAIHRCQEKVMCRPVREMAADVTEGLEL